MQPHDSAHPRRADSGYAAIGVAACLSPLHLHEGMA
jgi:hypothetical protein